MSNVFEDLLGAYDQLRKRTYKIVVEGKRSEEENLKQVAAGQPAKPIDQNAGSTLDQAAPGDVVEPDNSSNVSNDGQPNKYVVGDQGQLQKLEDDDVNASGDIAAPDAAMGGPVSPFPGLEMTETGKYTISVGLGVTQDIESKEFSTPLEAYSNAFNNIASEDIFGPGPEGRKGLLIPTYMNLLKGLEQFMGRDVIEEIKDSLKSKLASREAYFDYSELHNTKFATDLAQRFVTKYSPEELESFSKNTNKDFFGRFLADLLTPIQSVGSPEEGFIPYDKAQNIFSTFLSNRKLIFADEKEVSFDDKSFSSAFSQVVGDFYHDPVIGNGFIFNGGNNRKNDLILMSPSVKIPQAKGSFDTLSFSGPRKKQSLESFQDSLFSEKVEKILFDTADHARLDPGNITEHSMEEIVDKLFELDTQLESTRLLVSDDIKEKGYSFIRNGDLQALKLSKLYGDSNKFKDVMSHHIKKLLKASGNFQFKVGGEDSNIDYYHKVNGQTVCRMESTTTKLSSAKNELPENVNSIIKLFGSPDFNDEFDKYYEIVKDLVNTYNPDFPGNLLFKGMKNGNIDHNFIIREILFKGMGPNGKTNVENLLREKFKSGYPVIGANFNMSPSNFILYTELNGENFNSYKVDATQLNEYWSRNINSSQYIYNSREKKGTFLSKDGEKLVFSLPSLDMQLDNHESSVSFDIEVPTIKNHAEPLEDWIGIKKNTAQLAGIIQTNNNPLASEHPLDDTSNI